jgi:hypothetical protein
LKNNNSNNNNSNNIIIIISPLFFRVHGSELFACLYSDQRRGGGKAGALRGTETPATYRRSYRARIYKRLRARYRFLSSSNVYKFRALSSSYYTGICT